MAMLSEDDLYLINLLFYTEPSIRDSELSSCATVEEAVATIEAGLPNVKDDRGSFSTTKSEMEWAISHIKENPRLMEMEIATVKTDSYGAGTFVVKSPAGTIPREGVVVFEGSTTPEDWKDNFIGGSTTDEKDGVSTELQQEHLEYYQTIREQYLSDCDQITVTGHSKGGNKAKYVTIMDGSVDRCVSFDGQGFSDEFFEKYKDEIALRQDKIVNYNAKEDFVNILLNDVGEKHYIDGENKDNFFLNHSMFTMKDSLPLSKHYTEQSPGAKAFDKLVNSMLRSMPSEQRVSTLKLLGELMASGTSGELSIEKLLGTLAQGSYASDAGYLLAYIVKYMQTHPGDTGDMVEMLTDFNPALSSIVVLMLDHWGLFEKLLKASAYIAAGAKLAELLCKLLGIDPTFARMLADMMGEFAKTYFTCDFSDNGADLRIESTTDYKVDRMRVDADALEEAIVRLNRLASSIQGLSGDVRSCADQCEEEDIRIKISPSTDAKFFGARIAAIVGSLFGRPDMVLRSLARALDEVGTETGDLSKRLQSARELLTETEERNQCMFGHLEGAASNVRSSASV